jgi:hypothetical protein
LLLPSTRNLVSTNGWLWARCWLGCTIWTSSYLLGLLGRFLFSFTLPISYYFTISIYNPFLWHL